MTAKPTFIAPRTAQRPGHILRDLYLTDYENVRDSQRGGTDPSLWSYLAQTPMVAYNYRQPQEISLVAGMYIACRVSYWTTNLIYKTGKCKALSARYWKQSKSDFLFRSLISGFFLRRTLVKTSGDVWKSVFQTLRWAPFTVHPVGICCKTSFDRPLSRYIKLMPDDHCRTWEIKSALEIVLSDALVDDGRNFFFHVPNQINSFGKDAHKTRCYVFWYTVCLLQEKHFWATQCF
jgi:hypothetical protein